MDWTAQVKKALQSESDLYLEWPIFMGQWNPYSSSAVQPCLGITVDGMRGEVWLPVSHVRVVTVTSLLIKDEVVLTGDESLCPTAALHKLVAGPLHRPLAVPPGTVPHRIRLLKEEPPALLTAYLEWKPALLANLVEHQTILTEELR